MTIRSRMSRSACLASRWHALTFAISLDRIFDGFGRPFFGFVSDNIGREPTMFIAFGTAAIMLLTLSAYGHNPIVFVLATAVYFGVFGEIYSLFPATSGDTFGSKFATTNSGMLYTAKGTASLLVPLASHCRNTLRLAGCVRHCGGVERHCSVDGLDRHPADATRIHSRQRDNRFRCFRSCDCRGATKRPRLSARLSQTRAVNAALSSEMKLRLRSELHNMSERKLCRARCLAKSCPHRDEVPETVP